MKTTSDNTHPPRAINRISALCASWHTPHHRRPKCQEQKAEEEKVARKGNGDGEGMGGGEINE